MFTAGYERRSPEEFGDLLVGAGVRTLVDVRDFPRASKRGFGKRQMAWWLSELEPSVRYYHFRCFGVAKRTRSRYGSGSMTRAEFVDAYEQQLGRLADDLARLAGLVTSSPTVLMCREHDANDCHRSVLAWRLTQMCDLDGVRHL